MTLDGPQIASDFRSSPLAIWNHSDSNHCDSVAILILFSTDVDLEAILVAISLALRFQIAVLTNRIRCHSDLRFGHRWRVLTWCLGQEPSETSTNLIDLLMGLFRGAVLRVGSHESMRANRPDSRVRITGSKVCFSPCIFCHFLTHLVCGGPLHKLL